MNEKNSELAKNLILENKHNDELKNTVESLRMEMVELSTAIVEEENNFINEAYRIEQ